MIDRTAPEQRVCQILMNEINDWYEMCFFTFVESLQGDRHQAFET